jgi:hypothetical protein
MCNETGRYVMYESDRYGFNAPDDQWDEPARVALVGDSFVEGWCVPRDESFAGLIRRAVPATVNVGYSGHGPLAELGAIREYVASRRPADVFWFFYEGNDLNTDLPRELQTPMLRGYLQPGFSQQLQRRAAALGAEMRRQFEVRLADWTMPPARPAASRILALEALRGLVGERVEAEPSSPVPIPFAEFRQVLVEARRAVEAWGGSLHFVYLPDFAAVVDGEEPRDHDRVLALAAELGLEVIDLLTDFRTAPSPIALYPYEEGRHLVVARGLHYGRLGHALVAERVLAVLQRRSAGTDTVEGGRGRSDAARVNRPSAGGADPPPERSGAAAR